MRLSTTDINRDHGLRRNRKKHRVLLCLATAALLLLLLVGAVSWLGFRATGIKDELTSATSLVQPLKRAIAENDPETAAATVARLQEHTRAARELAQDPLWKLSAATPVLGANLGAVSEVAQTADDVATLGLKPLVKVFDSLDWQSLLPSEKGTDLEPLVQASPSVSSAAHVVRVSSERLDRIDESNLLPQVRDPLNLAREELRGVTGALDAASDAAALAPKMLGSESSQSYLLMIQNNAEARASGGIPGALAVLTIDKGKMSLGTQKSASQLGSLPTALSVDQEQENIYSSRLGKYIQDVNLTPDFPTAAETAQAIWEEKTGQRVDGVISIDPVVLSYIMRATGPIPISGSDLLPLRSAGLPTQLTGTNVVPTLLSEVYAKIEEPRLQDAYFAGVASEIFSALSSNKGDAAGVIDGLTRGTQEGRVLLWSGKPDEQSVISKYPVGGSVTGPSIAPAQFGVYFNDGTGAKMDYYVRRNVQLVKQCPANGYEQTTVRITSTNTAPVDAATALPEYVTGGGLFGVAPGVVQSNIVVYGPAQALVENATLNGQPTEFSPHFHATRPVGVVAQQLAPGESKTVEITFGKIVQHAEPNVVVTPSVQNVKDVVKPLEIATCG